MSGLWRNNPETPEGKYPIVLRRDGTPLGSRYIVMTLKDPGTAEALATYAAVHKARGSDEEYVRDLFALADQADRLAEEDRNLDVPTCDPDAPPHRDDDPVTLHWARSLGNPGS